MSIDKNDLKDAVREILCEELGLTKENILHIVQTFLTDALLEPTENGLSVLEQFTKQHVRQMNISTIESDISCKFTNAINTMVDTLKQSVIKQPIQMNYKFYDNRSCLLKDKTKALTDQIGIVRSEGAGNTYLKFTGHTRWCVGGNNVYYNNDVPDVKDFIINPGTPFYIKHKSPSDPTFHIFSI